ncbi:glycosyltransferase [Candidatus Pelagibacter sp.]|nr:glycosyltransferase [Candidatus Pelagibacter sp.]
MNSKKYTIVIDSSRNRSGGAIVYIKNFIEHLNLDTTKIEKIILISYKKLLKQIPGRSFLEKKSHPFLEKNIFFQIIWQWIILPIYLKKNKNNILFTTDSASFCNYKPSIIFNQDILSFDKNALNQISFGLEKIRLYLIRFIQVKAMNNASEIIFLSNFSQKIITKSLRKKINYKIIPHGVEKKLRLIGKKKLKNKNWHYKKKKKIKLIYVSPIFHYKNHKTVARSFSKLKKKYDNLEIKFVGNYDHNLELYNEIINNKSITKKNFTGEVSHKKVINLLNNSDIFIFASSSETFGISLVEAMALGMPIVCSNKSSLPEILEDGGLYFNPNIDDELSSQIETFIKKKKFRRDKAKKAFNLSLKYTWNDNVKKFCDITNKLLK